MIATDSFRESAIGMNASDMPSRNIRAAHSPHRVFLLQNHPLMILGTRSFIEDQPDMAVCGSATVPKAVFRNLPRPPPELIVFELSISGPFDFPFLQKLRTELPQIPVLAFSYHEEIIFAERALEAGATGYLMKEAEPRFLIEAIRHVAAGEIYLSERVRQRLELEKRAKSGLNGERIKSFSNRELQIFQALGEGFTNEGIAVQTGLSRQAIASAQYRMRKKLGLETRGQLVDCARHWTYYEGDFA